MKRVLTWSVCLWICVLGWCWPQTVQAQSYDKLWKDVEQAREKSLPQTVVKLTGQILGKAQAEKNVGQMLKAYICREEAECALVPDSLLSHVACMEQWVKTEPDAVNRAILHSLLAQTYADYMASHSRSMDSRTPIKVSQAPADLREWTANLFVDAVDRHVQAAMADSALLLRTDNTAYIPFVEQADGSRFYGHDLYHLLARRGVAAYNTIAWGYADQLVVERVEALYTAMEQAYARRPDRRDALLLCTLDHLQWKEREAVHRYAAVWQHVVRLQAREDYLQALDTLMARYADTPACCEVYIAKANHLATRQAKRPAEALRLCEEGLKRYASYKRVNELKNIRAGILQPQLVTRMSEGGYPADTVDLHVDYRNLDGLTLNVYATDLKTKPTDGAYVDPKDYKRGRRVSSVRYALQPLPCSGSTPDNWPYLSADTLLRWNAPQAPGVYILQLVPDKDTRQSSYRYFIVSRLKALALGVAPSKIEFTVVDARTGHPVSGATVQVYDDNWNTPKRGSLLTSGQTDEWGQVTLADPSGRTTFAASTADDTAMPRRILSYGGRGYEYGQSSVSRPRLSLLTDRTIYRPGQTVFVKGIAYSQTADSAHVAPEGEAYTLTLYDTNRKALSTRQVKTNAFGSFTADFVLPSACLNGSFRIEAKGRVVTTVSVRVEEYKRPNFEITFQDPEVAYRLGDTLTLHGQVKSFSGTSVQQMPLAYTIRQSDSWMLFRRPGEIPLVADTLTLDAAGRFAIDVPMPSIPHPHWSELYRRLQFTVQANVTNEAGETQSADYSFMATDHAYDLSADMPVILCREDSMSFRFWVRNASHVPVKAEGRYRIYTAKDGRSLQDDAMMREARSALGLPAPASSAAPRPVLEGSFQPNVPMDCSQWRSLPSGDYCLVLSVTDSLGCTEDNVRTGGSCFTLFSRQDKRLGSFRDLMTYADQSTFSPGRPASFFVGTSHKDVCLMMDILAGDRRVQSRRFMVSDTLMQVQLPYEESFGDGVAVIVRLVKEGNVHESTFYLTKTLPENTLDLKWEVFRDKLKPGQEEEWRLVIKDPKGRPAAAELLAMMYDASLDKLSPNYQTLQVGFSRRLPSVFRRESSVGDMSFASYFKRRNWQVENWGFDRFYSGSIAMDEAFRIRGFASPALASGNVMFKTANAMEQDEAVAVKNVPQAMEGASDDLSLADITLSEETVQRTVASKAGDGAAEATLQPMDGLRTNFAETAFFYPQLRTDKQGAVVISFTLPQSLTRWNFRGYAHTQDMRTGMLQATATASKDFMLTPNMPRFVRVGDQTRIAATIANQTDQKVKGTARLVLFDPTTEKVIDSQKCKFQAEAGRTTAVSFAFKADERFSLLGVRLTAESGKFSDGEQHILPVLSNKQYITETLPMPMRGHQTRTFALDSLFNRDHPSATQRRLTVEFTGNPAWYAVQALPTMALPQTDNATAWATSFYANTLAAFVANSQPRIKAVIDSWKQADAAGQPSFLGQLEKNQELKDILLNESPWLLEATSEADRMARMASLFDANQLRNRTFAALAKLQDLQLPDGSWCWFKGMNGSRTLTNFVTTLLVRLPLLTGQPLDNDAKVMLQQAMDYLHGAAQREYQDIRCAEREGTKIESLSLAALDYLYLVALSGTEVPADAREAYDYFLARAGKDLATASLPIKAQTVVILLKAGRSKEAGDYVASIREHLVQEEELGAHFAFADSWYSWSHFPICVHVKAMEALCMAGGHDALLEEMKIWLLKQKQTQGWSSSVTTADAVYALLATGDNWLDQRGDVRISLGKTVIETVPQQQVDAQTPVTPGLAYVKQTFGEDSKETRSKTVTVEKRDDGIAWGAVYAQYLSPMADLKQYGGALNIEKQLFVERLDSRGQRSLHPLAEGTMLTVGDKVVARLTLRTDRALEFVQLKDQRAACFEPLATLSGCRWSDGLCYYAEIEDAGMNYFIDHLPKGVYVLEHACRVVRAGTYETGIATLQCAYAPEFASHSAGGTVRVEPAQ